MLRPFLTMASLSPQAWGEQSSLVQAMAQLHRHVLAPLQTKTVQFSFLASLLNTSHWLALGLLLISCTFASTEVIGGLILLSSLVLGLRALFFPLNLRLNMIDLGVGIFFLTAIIATAFSSYLPTSLVGLLKFMIFFLGYLNFRVLASDHLSRWQGLLLLLVGLGTMESVIGLYQYINHVQPLATWQDTSVNPEDQLTRIFGTLQPSNPNLLAGFLIPALAAGSGLCLFNLAQKRFVHALGLMALTIPILIALVLTGSRGGYLSIMAMSGVLFMFCGHLLWHEPELKTHYRLKTLWLLTLIGTLAASAIAIGAISPLRNRVMSIFAMREDSSNSYRINVWTSTLRMIRDNWLVGIGPGNDTFKQVYGLYMTPGYNALSAYSIFLEIWAEQGLFGLLSFLILLMMVKLRTAIGVYTHISLQDKLLLGMLLTGITGSVVYGLFDTIWYRPSVNLLFWLMLAGFAVLSEKALETARSEGRR